MRHLKLTFDLEQLTGQIIVLKGACYSHEQGRMVKNDQSSWHEAWDIAQSNEIPREGQEVQGDQGVQRDQGDHEAERVQGDNEDQRVQREQEVQGDQKFSTTHRGSRACRAYGAQANTTQAKDFGEAAQEADQDIVSQDSPRTWPSQQNDGASLPCPSTPSSVITLQDVGLQGPGQVLGQIIYLTSTFRLFKIAQHVLPTATRAGFMYSTIVLQRKTSKGVYSFFVPNMHKTKLCSGLELI